MPRSRRAKVVPLTKVQKKTKDHKVKIVDAVRDNVGKYRYCHVIEIEHPKTLPLQNLREELKPGRIIAAKNRVMQVALGVTPESAAMDNIHKLSGLLSGNSMLILTDKNAAEIQPLLDQTNATTSFAIPGEIASETVELKAGLDTFEGYQHTLEPLLRKLGLPTQLLNGKIALLGDFVVCTAGSPLSVSATKILKQLGLQQGKLNIRLKGTYDTSNSAVLVAKP